MKELDLQKRIIDEVKASGGWGRKWATQFQNGVPDLILTLPKTGTFFVEVKLVERANFDFTKFRPAIKTTRLQVQEMARIKSAGGIAFVLVGVITPKEGRLYAAQSDAQELVGDEVYTEWTRSRIILQPVNLIGRFLHPWQETSTKLLQMEMALRAATGM
jgi:hypothetical protein